VTLALASSVTGLPPWEPDKALGEGRAVVAKTRWLDYCLAKPGAWQDEPWEGDVVAKVGDKIFAFLGSDTAIGLKCGDRETADLLLDRYPGVASKMAYIGQHGWNTFVIDGTIPPDEIQDLIDTSYDLIVAKLPKSKRPG
jgi:predicted DNA-binding protein (MmcQ/YjbR family)